MTVTYTYPANKQKYMAQQIVTLKICFQKVFCTQKMFVENNNAIKQKLDKQGLGKQVLTKIVVRKKI